MNESNELHMAEAVLGRDVAEFLAGDVGRYLLGRCEIEEKEGLRLLAVVSPWRRNRIRQLQNMVWRAQSLKEWLSQVVQAGQQAEKLLEED